MHWRFPDGQKLGLSLIHILLAISVDNRDNDTVYPQKADFTFYGGIYRDVTLHIVPAEHFALPLSLIHI